MKILHICYDWIDNPYFGGGAPRRIYNVCKEIVQLDDKIDIEVLVGNHPKVETKYKLYFDKIKVHYVGLKSPLILSAFSFSILSTLYVLKYRKEYDLIVNHIAPHIPTFTFINNGLNNKTIYVVHNYYNKLFFKKYSVIGILPYLIEKIIYNKGKYFIAVSKYIEKKIYNENKGLRVHLIYNGVNEVLLNNNLKSKPSVQQPYILYLGRVDIHQKGLDLLLDAFSLLQRKLEDQNIKLVIAGGGKDLTKIIEIVRSRKMENNVSILGYVDEDKKIEIIDSSLFAVMPSRFEAFPIVPIEVQARGKTLVASNRGGLSEVVINGKTGLLLSELNPKQLAYNMMMLIRDRKLRKSLESNAQKFARRFSWKEAALRELKVYRTIIKERDD